MASTISEFEMAVLCAFQYASASLKDQQAQSLKLQAETFCNSIKASVDGWRYELELFEFSEHQEVKFYALQALQVRIVKMERARPFILFELRIVISWCF